MAQLHFYHSQWTKRGMSWLSTGKIEAGCKKKKLLFSPKMARTGDDLFSFW